MLFLVIEPKNILEEDFMAVNWEKTSQFVGLIGGVLGIAVAAGGGVAIVIAYFATTDDLTVVDCHQYYGNESLTAQAEQLSLVPIAKNLIRAASEAEIAHQRDPGNHTLLTSYKEAVRAQNESLEKLNKARQKSEVALEEQEQCGHRGPDQL